MKKLLVIVSLLLFVQLHAQVRIDENEAFATAERFLLENTRLLTPALALHETIYSRQSGEANLYVFAVAPQGYVIVSALNDVLAYSLTSPMPNSEALPDHIRYWLDLYNETTDSLVEHPEQRKEPTRSQTAVAPMLTSCWGQGCYHNAACPVDASGPCHHVEAGCVAIAMAQIMYYHKQPQQGNGSLSYSRPPYGVLSANFGQTTYHWEEMVDTLHESNPAVARLVSHCGISVKMQYGPNGSAAFSQDVPDALRRYFFYPAASYSKRSFYNDDEWQSLIKNDLDRQLPVYYAGKSIQGGHAFVCDGYDSTGMFHFNFGWDGVADGYYTLSSPYGFSDNQSVVRNFYPIDEIQIHSDSHGIIYVAPDGEGDGSSWAQATPELQLAIIKSTMGNCSIWVKEGTYTGIAVEDFAFSPMLGCRLYGGFKGDEPFDYDLSQRDFEAHPSILDGGQAQGVIGGLPYNDELIIIDGFTIQNGNSMYGGGIRLECNAQIRNCKFCNNHATYGGAISQRSLTESRTIIVENCEFIGNEADYGGAIADYGNTTFVRCFFHDNHAQSSGGAVRCNSHIISSQFVNCTFSNNTAPKGGGISVFSEQRPTFWSCLINNNTAETGGGFHLATEADLFNCTIVKNKATLTYGGIYTETPTDIRNCIIWGNASPLGNSQIGPTQTYSCCAVQDDLSTTGGNFNAEAANDGDSGSFFIRFKDSNVSVGDTGHGGDWRLQSNSPCIDMADSIAGQPEFDLEGNPRLRHQNVDLGAYESNTKTHFIEAFYCEETPYYYQDSLIPGVGYYTFLYPNDTYDSLVILHMTYSPASIFQTEEICESDSFDFFGHTLTEAGLYHETIDCVTYELSLSTRSLTPVTMQEEICDFDTFNFVGTMLNESGTYYDTVDCIAYRLDLDVKPSESFLWRDTICEGEVYDFLGRSLRKGGHYTKAIGCLYYDLYLTMNPRPAIQCSNDTLVEYGSTVTLTATGADSYLWSTGETTASITVTPKEDQTYYVTGYSELGCGSLESIKVTIDFPEDEIIIYPNPANDKVEIYMPLIDEVEVFNLMGARMEHIQTEREAVTLDVSHYPDGIYIIHVRQLNKHHYKKLVIRH